MRGLSTKGNCKEQRITLLKYVLDNGGFSLDCLPFKWLESTDFFTAPASTAYHGAYEGGLFDHCMNVMFELIDLSDKGVTSLWKRPESPIIIGILHDATKFNMYKLGEDGNYHHDPEWFPGFSDLYIHGADSLQKVKAHFDITEEETYCIRWHMGAYDTNTWDMYDLAIRRYPNVLWTHTADMYASKILEEGY